MSLLHSLRYRLGALLRPRTHDRELAEEMEFHLDLEEMQQSHRESADPRHAARRRFGNVTWYREESRNASGLGGFDVLWQDIRFAMRTFRRAPTFTFVVVTTLAIGIGANTAIFSVLDALLIRPLPFRDPERLMNISLTGPRSDGIAFSGPKFALFRAGQTAFENTSLVHGSQFTIRIDADALRESGEAVDSHYLPTLGITPALGRGLLPAEDNAGAPRVILLSDGFWRRAFAADPHVLGRSVEVDGSPFTVVGVTPPGFAGVFGEASFWIPVAGMPAVWEDYARAPYNHGFFAIGRRAAGVTPERAAMVARELGVRIDAAFPNPDARAEHWGATARPLDIMRVDPDIRRGVLVLFGAVGLVLLIACANVANLFLVRAVGRRREIAVRLAIGASRWRLIRQLLVESMLLASFGGVLAIVVAWAGMTWLSATNTFQIREVGGIGAINFQSVRLDRTALAFTAVIAIVTGIGFGLVPAIQSTRLSLTESLRNSESRWTVRLRGLTSRNVLTIVELTLAVVLLAGSGLMIRSLRRLTAVRPGFDASHVLTLRVNRAPRWSRDSIDRFFDLALARLARIPGVESVAMNDCPPLSGGCGPRGPVLLPDRSSVPDEQHLAGVHWITPDWPAMMRVPLLRGRFFDRHDDKHSPLVALVSAEAARKLWPGEDPIGKPINAGGGHDTVRVVGVVGDVLYGSLAGGPRPEVYVPYFQQPLTYRMMFFVRTTGDPSAIADDVRAAIREVAPGFPMYDVATMEWRVGAVTAYDSTATALLTLFAAVAIILAAIGTYGVISFAVAQRRQEIGVRMALGATAGSVTRLVVGQGVALGAIGLACGVVASFGVTRLMRNMLYGVTPNDPVTYAGIVAVLAVAVVAASLIPARRAASVSAMSALRAD